LNEPTSAQLYYQIIHGARLPESEAAPQDDIISNFIDRIFDPMLSSPLQNFLNESVIIHPSADQIHNYTIMTAAPHQMNDNCAICQDPIEEGQSMRILNYCTHSFHTPCIDTWFRSHVTCPTCRHDIRNNNG
jgi:hypothetical protein